MKSANIFSLSHSLVCTLNGDAPKLDIAINDKCWQNFTASGQHHDMSKTCLGLSQQSVRGRQEFHWKWSRHRRFHYFRPATDWLLLMLKGTNNSLIYLVIVGAKKPQLPHRSVKVLIFLILTKDYMSDLIFTQQGRTRLMLLLMVHGPFKSIHFSYFNNEVVNKVFILKYVSKHHARSMGTWHWMISIFSNFLIVKANFGR